MNKRQDLFQEYLEKKDKNELVQNALTDSSYKAFAQNGVKKKKDPDKFAEVHSITDNQNLSTLGDAVIKLCYCDLLLEDEKLTKTKEKLESDKVLVEKVAEHYDLIKYINKDDNNSDLPRDYAYKGEGYKYIATAVEAMVGAIYKDKNRDLKPIIKLLKSWMDF